MIGAGSAGCVLAGRLSEKEDVRVLLLEAGGPDADPRIHQPEGFRTLWGSELDWGYVTEPQARLDDRRIPCPRGRVLGGSSSINGMLYVRGHARDFDHWAATGNRGWAYRDLLPYFIRSENFDAGPSEYHGTGGPLEVKQKTAAESTAVELAFLAAAGEYGFDDTGRDFNGAVQENGAGFHQVTISPDGMRSSASTAFLRPARSRPNLHVETGAVVHHLLVEGDRVRGVEFRQGTEVRKALADAEVVLSAGAIDSPKVLMLSGIGPAPLLSSLGIQVIADRPEVGAGLQDHLIVGVGYAQPGPVPAPRNPVVGEVGLFTRSPWDTGQMGPDLQFHVFRDLHLDPADAVSPARPGFTIAPTLLQPRSRGFVALRSSDPRDPVRIEPRFFFEDDDLRTMVHGVRQAREIARMPALAGFRAEEVTPGAKAVTDRELRRYVTARAETVFHPVGTCRMGTDDSSVVDENLRVRGVQSLRIVDASIMPWIVSANTNAAAIMIGEKGADLIRTTGGPW